MLIASRCSSTNSISLVADRTGALWIDDPRFAPRRERASRSYVRPPCALASRYPTGAFKAMTAYVGRWSTTSENGETKKGSSGAKTVPCSLAGAINHDGPHGVTPATTEYGRSGPRERVTPSRGRVRAVRRAARVPWAG